MALFEEGRARFTSQGDVGGLEAFAQDLSNESFAFLEDEERAIHFQRALDATLPGAPKPSRGPRF